MREESPHVMGFTYLYPSRATPRCPGSDSTGLLLLAAAERRKAAQDPPRTPPANSQEHRPPHLPPVLMELSNFGVYIGAQASPRCPAWMLSSQVGIPGKLCYPPPFQVIISPGSAMRWSVSYSPPFQVTLSLCVYPGMV